MSLSRAQIRPILTFASLVLLALTCACLALLARSLKWIGHSYDDIYWYDNPPSRPKLPPDTSFNSGAGLFGEHLLVKLRSGTGEAWLFMVDTGSEFTILDKSLEAKLGPRLNTKEISYGWTGKATVGIYDAPQLFLGDTQLLTGPTVWTDDLAKFDPDVQGLLGMDCLHYYCFALDFGAKKLRFLDPDHLSVETLGKPFPLFKSSTCSTTFRGDFMEARDAAIGVDTGAYDDGSSSQELLQQAMETHEGEWITFWKDGSGAPSEAHFNDGKIGDFTYPDLILANGHKNENCIGLRFLARHLVTFNFPKRTMYLLRQSNAALPDNTTALIESLGDGAGDAAIGRQVYRYLIHQPGGGLSLEGLAFVKRLANNSQLPGLPDAQAERLGIDPLALREADSAEYPARRSYYGGRADGQSLYKYAVIKQFETGDWKLTRAWRTDLIGHVQEEYAIP
jgi:hypothetical protein